MAYIANLIMNRLQKSIKNNKIDSLNKLIFHSLRKMYNSYSDPLVEVHIGKYKILAYLSHDFPIFFSKHRYFSRNVGRIAKYIKHDYPKGSIIDIGANVGDTAAIIRSFVDSEIICIEGDPKYYQVLRMNQSKIPNIIIKNEFIGVGENFEIDREGGSGKLVKTHNEKNSVKFNSLQKAIQETKTQFKFVKIDTDGFDLKIIKNELQFFIKHKPVIFFEYDPYLMEENKKERLQVFQELRRIGYRKCLVYENTGELLMQLDLNTIERFEDLDNYYLSLKGQRYCDMCLFHKEDMDLAKKTRIKELEFFRKN